MTDGSGDDLTMYGLAGGEDVRFRWKAGGKWRDGKVLGLYDDGSLKIHDNDRGYSRAIAPGVLAEVQYKTNGPRGGTRWVPVEGRR